MGSPTSDSDYGFRYDHIKDAGGYYSDGRRTTSVNGYTTDWEPISIETMNQMVARLGDGQFATAAAQWRKLATELRDMLSKTRSAADAMEPKWDPAKSDAASIFFDRIGGTTFSLNQWAARADTNAAAIEQVHTTLVAVRREVKRIYAEFLVAYNAHMDKSNAYTNGASLPAIKAPARPIPDKVRRDTLIKIEQKAANAVREKYTALVRTQMEILGQAFRVNTVSLVEGVAFQGPTAVAKPSISFPGGRGPGMPGSPGAAASAAAAAAAARLRQQQAALAAQQAAAQQQLAAQQAAAQQQLAAQQAAAQQQMAAAQAAAQQQLSAAQQQLAAAQSAAQQQLSAAQLAAQQQLLAGQQLAAQQRAAGFALGQPLSAAQLLAAGPGMPGVGAVGSPASLSGGPGALRQLPSGLTPGQSLQPGQPGMRSPGMGAGSGGGAGLRGRLANGAPGTGSAAGQPPLSGRRDPRGQRDQAAEERPAPPAFREEREDYLGEAPTVGDQPLGRLLSDGQPAAAPPPPPGLAGRGASANGPGSGRRSSGASATSVRRDGAGLSGRRARRAEETDEVLAPESALPQDLTRRPERARPGQEPIAGQAHGVDAELLGIRRAEKDSVPGSHVGAPQPGSLAATASTDDVEGPSLWAVQTPTTLDAPAPTKGHSGRGEVLGHG